MKTPSTLAVRPFPKDLIWRLKVACAEEQEDMTVFLPKLIEDALQRREIKRGLTSRKAKP